MATLTDSLADTFDRIDDFHAVHRGRPASEHMDSVICLQEAVDIDDDARVLIRDRLPNLPIGDEHRGAVILGLVIGLMAAQLATEGDEEAALSG